MSEIKPVHHIHQLTRRLPAAALLSGARLAALTWCRAHGAVR